MLEIGMKNATLYRVRPEHSASVVGSGDLEVLSTPYLLAYMENAAKELIRPELEDGKTTVGIDVKLEHLAPSKIGDELTVECELKAIEGRILILELTARDADKIVGKATHKRCIVTAKKFMEKLQ